MFWREMKIASSYWEVQVIEDSSYRESTVHSIIHWINYYPADKVQGNQLQRAKKVVSDGQGLMDFAIGLVNSVLDLPDGQVMFLEEFK